jgi:hypothetical protein
MKKQKNCSDKIQLTKIKQLEENEALNPLTGPSTTGISNENYVPGITNKNCGRKFKFSKFRIEKQKFRKSETDGVQLTKFRQLEETEVLNPSTAGPSTMGILRENYNPKFKFSKFRVDKLKFRKVELQTFQQWDKKTKDEFLNPPLRCCSYTAQTNGKIKLQNPFLASILSKLHLAKKKHQSETRVAIDGFDKVDLFAYEKTRAQNPAAASLSAGAVSSLPTEIQAEIHVYEELQHQSLPAEPTQTKDSIQADSHVFEEIQHCNLLSEPAQHSNQAETHVCKEIQLRPLPVEPTPDSIQVQIMEKDDFEDVDLHSNNSNNENDLQEKIYSQATGFWACIRKWL